MSKVKELRQELKFSEELRGVLGAMKQVAASDLRRWERRRPVLADLIERFQQCFALLEGYRLPSRLLHPAGEKTGILLVTSELGFVGALNTQVVRTALGQEGTILVIGEQGRRILAEERGSPPAEAVFSGIGNPSNLQEQLASPRELLLRQYFAGELGRILVVFPSFVSIARQRILTRQLLPVPKSSGPVPRLRDLVMEGPLEQVEEAIAQRWLDVCLVDIAWNAKLSELAARALHLEGALEELSSQHRQLKGVYFRALHEGMDQVIRECMASRRIAEGIAR